MPPAPRHLRAALALLLLAGCSTLGRSQAGRVVAAKARPADEIVAIGDKSDEGDVIALEARLCRPAILPAPVLVLNHGAPALGGNRLDIRPAACASPAVRWFLSRGYLVVLPMRRGYGRGGGDWAENPGACASPDYARAARAGGHDVALAVAYAVTLPDARPDGLVVVGWDTGGLATLAYAAANPPPGTRAIVMAGGGGVRVGAADAHVCRPDLLVETVAELGKTARAPMLWVYALNDGLITPELATSMSAAFGAAGGNVTLKQPEAPVADGHDLFFANAGPAVWGPLVEGFLAP